MNPANASVPINEEIWVNEFTEVSASNFRKQLFAKAEDEPNKPIVVYIDSYGGYVDSLAKMIESMNEVRASNHRIITVCMGKAMSCGAILLSCGDVRFCGEYSRVMIHNVSACSWGDAFSIKEAADETMRINEKFMGLLAINCGVTYSDIQNKIRASTSSKELWFDAQSAKDFGIVDEIGLPVLRQSVTHEYLTMKLDKSKEIEAVKPDVPKKPIKKKKANKINKKTVNKKRS